MATPSSCAVVCSRPIASALACPHSRCTVTSEGGSPSCCAAVPGSTNLTTPAPPTGTAITRPTSTPTTAFAPAVSSPQHPSPSEPLEGIPAGAPEGSRPAPVIGEPRWQGLPRASDRTIRTAPAHCPTALATWVTRWAFAALTPTTPPPAPWAACSSRARRRDALRITSRQRAEGGPERSGRRSRTQL